MKKYLILFFLLLTPVITNAISGACSYHGGVNCSWGSNNSGNVVCNDGFNSSVPYYQATECTVTKCKTEDDIARIRSLNLNSGLIDSPMGNSNINRCEQEIREYQESITNSNESITNVRTSYSSPSLNIGLDNVCIKYHGSASVYVESKDRCECTSGYAPDLSVPFRCQTINSYCKEDRNYGVFSHSITNVYTDSGYIENICACDKGFWLVNKKCQSPLVYCVEKYSRNSHAVYDGTPLNCQCDAGYSTSSSIKCEKIPETNTSGSLDNIFGQKSVSISTISNTPNLPELPKIPKNADAKTFQNKITAQQKLDIDKQKIMVTATTTPINISRPSTTTQLVEPVKHKSLIFRAIEFIGKFFKI